MAKILTAKDPEERVDYLWTPPLDDGDTITGTPTISRLDGTATLDAQSNTTTTVTLWFAGGTAGETTTFVARVTTAGGRTFEEGLFLPVRASTYVETDLEKLQADLTSCRQARVDLMTGKRVEEVWRSGRRITFGKVTLDSMNVLIGQLEREIEGLTNAAIGRPRRRMIGISY